MGKTKEILKRIFYGRKEKEIFAVPQIMNSPELLKGKVALITGGSSGIGYAIAEVFLKCGCKVIIAGSHEDKLEKAKISIGGGYLQSIVIDVRDVATLFEKIEAAAALFEENRIDILVNSAGAHHTKRFDSMTEEEYDCIMDTNVKGLFFLCQAMGRYMKDRKIKGHILNLSSSSALRPASDPYKISKWAVRGFTLGLAKELQPYGIVVNAIAPGQTATPMLGKSADGDLYNSHSVSGRYILPSEVAALAVFLASDLGNMIVGDTVYMTGGSALVTLNG